MPKVLIASEVMTDVDAPYARMLREAGFEVQYPDNRLFARGAGGAAETIAELQGIDAVLAGGEIYTPEVFERLPNLKVVARVGVGYDRVDIPAASSHKVVVTITPTANHQAVAEHAMALILGVAKTVASADRRMRAGGWRAGLTRPVRGQTLGVLGLGRIGRSMVEVGIGMRMRVIATEMYPNHDFVTKNQIELVDFDTLLAQSDFLSIHCPHTPETEGLFNAATFAKMKPGAVLINTARGPLVKEADLLQALKSGHLSGAGLDVFETEPTGADNPLFALDNVVVTPHLAGIDERSLEDMGIEAAAAIIALKNGDWPTPCIVNSELEGGWKWSAEDA